MIVIGIDEVGRGALAGPMLVTGAIINSDHHWFEALTQPSRLGFEFYLDVLNRRVLRDSKKLTPNQRRQTAELLLSQLNFITMLILPESIDKDGLSHVFDIAVGKIIAKAKLQFPDDKVKILVDGRRCPRLNQPKLQIEAVVDGDDKIGLIAAASVIAKVKRDNLMLDLDQEYPDYKWQSNVGYGTKDHIQAILKYGPTKHHRRSFLTKITKNNFFRSIKQPKPDLNKT